MHLRTRAIIIFAAIIAFISIAGFILIQSIEIVTEDVYVGYTGEARNNPYLAAERLLQNRGLAVNSIYNEYQLGDLLKKPATLFFLASSDTFKEQNLYHLLDWVESGGNLIVNLPQFSFNLEEEYYYKDFFTEYLGVKIIPSTDESITDYEITVKLPDMDKELSVKLKNHFFLEDTEIKAAWPIQQNGNNLLLQYKMGAGFLSITTSLAFMENDMIGQQDNAVLFWYLVTQGAAKRTIWFLQNHELKSFWHTLFQYSWMFWLSLLLFLLFFIWKSSQRFGPLISTDDTVRKSLIEHVYASGQLLWRKKEGLLLLNSIRQAVIDKIKNKLKVWDTLSASQKLELLKQRTELKEEVLTELFNSDNQEELSKNKFLFKVKLLERIYQKV
jgi:hypothetical protein